MLGSLWLYGVLALSTVVRMPAQNVSNSSFIVQFLTIRKSHERNRTW